VALRAGPGLGLIFGALAALLLASPAAQGWSATVELSRIEFLTDTTNDFSVIVHAPSAQTIGLLRISVDFWWEVPNGGGRGNTTVVVLDTGTPHRIPAGGSSGFQGKLRLPLMQDADLAFFAAEVQILGESEVAGNWTTPHAHPFTLFNLSLRDAPIGDTHLPVLLGALTGAIAFALAAALLTALWATGRFIWGFARRPAPPPAPAAPPPEKPA